MMNTISQEIVATVIYLHWMPNERHPFVKLNEIEYDNGDAEGEEKINLHVWLSNVWNSSSLIPCNNNNNNENSKMFLSVDFFPPILLVEKEREKSWEEEWYSVLMFHEAQNRNYSKKRMYSFPFFFFSPHFYRKQLQQLWEAKKFNNWIVHQRPLNICAFEKNCHYSGLHIRMKWEKNHSHVHISYINWK